jgi:Flp pilus assembly protein TadG
MKSSHPLKDNNLRDDHRHSLTPGMARARKQRGQAMVELAIALPILLLLTLGVIEFGRAAYYSIEVSDAARAGAQYGSQSLADAANTVNITQAALNSAQDISAGITFNPPPAQSCVCPGTAAVTGGDCTGLLGCFYPMVYVTVTTKYTLDTLFQYPGLPTSFSLNGSSTMPVQRQ